MIYDMPKNWQDLQKVVKSIFEQIGFEAHVDYNIKTPRGSVDIDVFAIEKTSVNRNRYIVECKYWKSKIPQTVIHSFTTVMGETGGNVGYIISKKGTQSGGLDYTNSTNIKALTFDEFQKMYFEVWFVNYFIPTVKAVSEHLSDYTEPINSRRFRHMDLLSEGRKEKYFEVYNANEHFSYWMFSLSNTEKIEVFYDLEKYKINIKNNYKYQINSNNYIDLLSEVSFECQKRIKEFDSVFGMNIFNT